MSERFADLFNESLKDVDLRPGHNVKGTIVKIGPDFVTVSAGLKSESYIPIEEFNNGKGLSEVREGDIIDVYVEAVEDGSGNTRLSREKAKKAEIWATLEKAYAANETVVGTIAERVKGGFTVLLDKVRAFLPGSLIDVKPVRDPSYLEGKELEFKLIKLDPKRNNIVVSRRAVVEQESGADRENLLAELQEGQEVTGVVKNLTDYGAFIDLGGADGLLHITDMAWKRIKHPNEMLAVGDEIKVRVLKFDREKNRVSLGLKQLGDDPWHDIAQRYPVGIRLFGKVTNITDYGCFVELEEGIEGLAHMSEMDWTNKNIHPAKVVQLGDEIEIMVLEIDENKRRISLGIKQCVENPWQAFMEKWEKGDKVKGNIRSITDFGIFIGLDGGIDGLVHLSDISWSKSGEEAIRDYKKGQEVEAVILSIDPDRERISLGIKQLEEDPYGSFMQANPKGSIVEGKIIEVTLHGAVVDLGNGVQGYIAVNEIDEHISDARTHLSVGNTVKATFISVDRKRHILNLSMKGKSAPKRVMKDQDAPVNTPLGELLKGKMDQESSDD